MKKRAVQGRGPACAVLLLTVAGTIAAIHPTSSRGQVEQTAPSRIITTELRFGHQKTVVAGVPITLSGNAYAGVGPRLVQRLGPYANCAQRPNPWEWRASWPRLGLVVDFASILKDAACGPYASVLRLFVGRSWQIHTNYGDIQVGMKWAAVPRTLRRTSEALGAKAPGVVVYGWRGQDSCHPRKPGRHFLLTVTVGRASGRVTTASFATTGPEVLCP